MVSVIGVGVDDLIKPADSVCGLCVYKQLRHLSQDLQSRPTESECLC